MCCLIGALLIAALAAWRRWTSAVRACRPRARLAAATAFVVIGIASSVLTVQHLGRYAARANASGRNMLAGAQPICGGSLGRRGEAQVAQLK